MSPLRHWLMWCDCGLWVVWYIDIFMCILKYTEVNDFFSINQQRSVKIESKQPQQKEQQQQPPPPKRGHKVSISNYNFSIRNATFLSWYFLLVPLLFLVSLILKREYVSLTDSSCAFLGVVISYRCRDLNRPLSWSSMDDSTWLGLVNLLSLIFSL